MTSVEGDTYVLTGNVGIGTASPLDNVASSSGDFADIGLHVKSSSGAVRLIAEGDSVDLVLADSGGSVNDRIFDIISDSGNLRVLARNDDLSARNDNILVLDHGTGNVGIGTTDPTGGKLVVKGTIRAKEIKVENNIAANDFTVKNSAWSDFVFKDGYKLPDLKQVESYIKENKHLPDIPSAKEVKENGIGVSEMMAKQMQKIEELTLYVIEQNNKLVAQNEKIEDLEKKLAELEERK